MSIRSGLSRLLRVRRDRRSATWPDPDDPELAVVVEAPDETEPASTVLARSPAWNPDLPVVLRYSLTVGTGSVRALREPLEAEGWLLRTEPGTAEHGAAGEADAVIVIAQCVRRIDAVTCSRETSRMVGLAQRHGGELAGWRALQVPGASDPSRT